MKVEGVAEEKIALAKVFDLDGNRVAKAKDRDSASNVIVDGVGEGERGGL